MLAFIRAGGDVGQGMKHVLVGDLSQVPVALQFGSDAVQTPGAAEIQAVQVDELAVLAVGDLPGGQGKLFIGKLRQELFQPEGELFFRPGPGA